MQEDEYKDHFTIFPYKSERRDDGINNGGIDLTKTPERIEDIHEIVNYPFMRKVFLDINAPNQIFMTFGCDLGIIDELHSGYFDFSFRPETKPNYWISIRELDNQFHDYLSTLNHHGNWTISPTDYAKSILRWEHSPVMVHGSQRYDKVCVWIRVKEIEAFE